MKKFKIDFSFYLLLFCFLFSPHQEKIFYLLFVIFIHEIGHIFFIFLYNIKIKKIRLYALGFLMDIDNENLNFIKELFVYFGGIIFNVIILFITPEYIHDYIFIIIILNLLPIYPLDGYMILKTILSYFIPYKVVLYLVNYLGLIILIIIFFYIFNLFDGLLIINFIYIFLVQLKEIKNINNHYNSFILRRFLNPPSFNERRIKIKLNPVKYIFKYHLFFFYVGNNKITELDILKLKYNYT